MSEEGANPALHFFVFFGELEDLVVPRGVNTFSRLEFNPLGSFPLLSAGCLGDFKLGEAGGVNEGLVLVVLIIVVGGGGDAGSGEVGDFGEIFLNEWCLSRLGIRLQVGWRAGRPLIWALDGVISIPWCSLDLEEHILNAFGLVQYWENGWTNEWMALVSQISGSKKKRGWENGMRGEEGERLKEGCKGWGDYKRECGDRLGKL